MQDSKTGKAERQHAIFKAYWNFCNGRLAIVSVVAAILAVLTFASPPTATAQVGWNTEQDSCSSLDPVTTPNYFPYEGPTGTLEPPPAGWGDPMLDPSGNEAHWSWDGQHSIAACDTKGMFAAYTTDGGAHWTESRSHSNLSGLGNGYGAAFQCVELAHRYAYARWGDLPSAWSGNASYLYLNGNHPSHFFRHDNGTTYLPAVGDIVVWGPVDSSFNPYPAGGAGHIGIISHIDLVNNTVQIFEQNWGTLGLGFHTLDLYVTTSGGSTLYTIGNQAGKPSTLQIDSNEHPHAYRFDTGHYTYGVLSDPSGPTDPHGPVGTQSCTTGTGPHLTSYCDGPTTTIFCGGAIGSTNDFSGVPINWTYTNGSTVCDRVTYNFNYGDTRRDCSYYVYIPNGHATTTIRATLSDGTQQSFYENPVAGWQYWFDAVGITSLTFSDANGTTSQQLGWGRTSTWSIARVCAF